MANPEKLTLRWALAKATEKRDKAHRRMRRMVRGMKESGLLN